MVYNGTVLYDDVFPGMLFTGPPVEGHDDPGWAGLAISVSKGPNNPWASIAWLLQDGKVITNGYYSRNEPLYGGWRFIG